MKIKQYKSQRMSGRVNRVNKMIAKHALKTRMHIMNRIIKFAQTCIENV